MKKLQSIKEKARKGFVGLLGSAILSACSPEHNKIEPIGWHDFNQDGVEDAITMVITKWNYDGYGNPYFYKQPSWVDGRTIYDPNGSREWDPYGNETTSEFHSRGIRMPIKNTPWIKDETTRENPEYPRCAKISDVNGDGNLDLELYTQISSEPAARHDVFYNIK